MAEANDSSVVGIRAGILDKGWLTRLATVNGYPRDTRMPRARDHPGPGPGSLACPADQINHPTLPQEEHFFNRSENPPCLLCAS